MDAWAVLLGVVDGCVSAVALAAGAVAVGVVLETVEVEVDRTCVPLNCWGSEDS